MIALKEVEAVDLFCGAGGTSAGLMEACEERRVEVRLTAINHWRLAIQTHLANHPGARHICASLVAIEPEPGALFSRAPDLDPREVMEARPDLLVASPECTHHSNARGGKPRSDQSRASANAVVRWAREKTPSFILVENVPEFVSWGPLYKRGRRKDKPIVARKGEHFRRFLRDLEAAGYNVEWRVLNCADYGDPTTRHRFFAVCARKPLLPPWPEPTHAKDGAGGLKPWRAAREIIDWSMPGHSIFLTKEQAKAAKLNIRRPLCENTMARIAAGLQKFGGPLAEPFLTMLRGTSEGHLKSCSQPTDEPVPTLTAGGNHVGLCRPFLVRYQGSHEGKTDGDGRVQDVDAPLPVQDTSNRYGICRPFVLPHRTFKNLAADSVEKLLRTVTACSSDFAVVEPFLLPGFGERKTQAPRVHSLDDPAPTICAQGHMHVAQPFVMDLAHTKGQPRTYGPDGPMPALTTTDAWALARPFISVMNWTKERGHDERYSRGLGDPLPTVTGQGNRFGFVNPFVVKYYGTADCQGVEDPLHTVTAKPRFGLAEPLAEELEPGTYLFDILYRMMQPHELAAAMSFPEDYEFQGTKGEVVKQIGNAVPVKTAAALCGAILDALELMRMAA